MSGTWRVFRWACGRPLPALSRVVAARAPHGVRALATAAAAAAIAAASAAAAAEAAPPPPPPPLVPPIETQSIQLADGRRLAYRCYGDPAGVPVYALHGMGSSHCTFQTDEPLAALAPGVLLVALDRPGYGDSDNPPAGYSYAAFARDLATLATALGHERFAVCGHSSGGPYALAAAALLPERVLACAAISSDPPYNHPEVPEAVRKSDNMAEAGKGGFYGVDPVEQVRELCVHTASSPYVYFSAV